MACNFLFKPISIPNPIEKCLKAYFQEFMAALLAQLLSKYHQNSCPRTTFNTCRLFTVCSTNAQPESRRTRAKLSLAHGRPIIITMGGHRDSRRVVDTGAVNCVMFTNLFSAFRNGGRHQNDKMLKAQSTKTHKMRKKCEKNNREANKPSHRHI